MCAYARACVRRPAGSPERPEAGPEARAEQGWSGAGLVPLDFPGIWTLLGGGGTGHADAALPGPANPCGTGVSGRSSGTGRLRCIRRWFSFPGEPTADVRHQATPGNALRWPVQPRESILGVGAVYLYSPAPKNAVAGIYGRNLLSPPPKEILGHLRGWIFRKFPETSDVFLSPCGTVVSGVAGMPWQRQFFTTSAKLEKSGNIYQHPDFQFPEIGICWRLHWFLLS